jgi:hypothetical protein
MLTALLNNNQLKLLNTTKGELESLEFAPEVVGDSKILDITSFSTRLKEKITANKWEGKKVAVGLNEENTFQTDCEVVKGAKDYLDKVGSAISKKTHLKPSELYITTKIVSETESTQKVQIAAVEKAFLDNFAGSLLEAGLKVDYFVPLALGLASLAESKEKPHLLLCADEKEVFYVFVGQDGIVLFSATYPANDVIQASEQVVKYLSEKFPEQVVRKTLIYGKDSARLAADLKKNGLVVEELLHKFSKYPLLELIAKFSDAKLIFMPPHLAKETFSKKTVFSSLFKSGSASQVQKKQTVPASESPLAKDISQNEVSEPQQLGEVEPKAQAQKQQDVQPQQLGEEEVEDVIHSEDLPDLPLPAASSQKIQQESVKSSFLKSSEAHGNKKNIVFAILGFVAVALILVAAFVLKPWDKFGGKESLPEVVPEVSKPQGLPEQQPEKQASLPAQLEDSGKEIVKSEYSIEVLNGRGTPGLAAAAKETLLEAGWESVEVGNADERSQSIVQYGEGSKALAEALMKDLSGDFEFSEPEPLDPSSSFDAVIIIGNK